MNTFVRLSVINQRDVERVREKHRKDRRKAHLQEDQRSLGSENSNWWSTFLSSPTVVNILQQPWISDRKSSIGRIISVRTVL